MKRIIRFFFLAVLATSPGIASARTEEFSRASLQADNHTSFNERLLDLHNRERERVGQPKLIWDAALAQSAGKWANRLAARGRLEHAPRWLRQGQGENLWRGTAGAYTPEEMVGHLIDERQQFLPGVFPAVVRSGSWREIGHYTQIIWPTTRAMGCAVASRRGSDYLVCRFFPAGNIVGQAIP